MTIDYLNKSQTKQSAKLENGLLEDKEDDAIVH
jgi:hypothetical protein